MNKLSCRTILICVTLLMACNGNKKDENNALKGATTSSVGSENYTIDTKQSVITWKGANLVGSNRHTGYIYLSIGALMIKNAQLVGGNADVNMNSIEDENHDSGKDNGLIKHLKYPDFFDVSNFPSANIVLTEFAPTNTDKVKITANLTIKGITHPINFLATVETRNRISKMNGRIVIDRTKWNIRYKSGKFFDLVADQTISDFIEFDVKIMAKK